MPDSQPLLKTKLFIPRVRHGNVARPRLFARIDQGVQGRLTLISAPAGSGKTTLLSGWCATATGRGMPVAWVSLDEADSLPHRFWLYVAEALQVGEVVRLLSGPQPPPPEILVPELINALADRERDTVLLLDDYHVISSAEVHQSMALLLDQLPPRLHVVIMTRVDPPLPLARLRAQRELVEIHLPELRFTTDEAAAFLDQAMGLRLTDQQVALLEERTEGWIAGLQLAALSLEQADNADRFVQGFAGSHQYILDYLVEEVLQAQPPEVERFLLRTSILGRLSGPLCNAVTGRSDGQAILESLERRNLFVVALDHGRCWYRYHHLFAEAMRERLIRDHADQVADLHALASRWYEREGLIEPAVEHALAACDWDRAVELVAVSADQIWQRGDSATLMAWRERLPDELLRSRPDLSFSIAWACLTSGRPDLAEALLQSAEERLAASAAGEGELLGKVLATRGHVARVQLNMPAATDYSRRALAVLPERSVAWRGWAVWNLGAVRRWCGELNEALLAFDQAKHLFRKAGDLNGFLRATVWQVEVMADGGHLPEALAEAEAALAMAQAEGGAGELPLVSLGHLAVAEMRYEQFALATAEEHLQRALALSQRGGLLDVVWMSYLPLALVRQALGDPDGAIACLDSADRLAPRVPWALATAASARARLLQLQGKTTQVTSLARQMESLARQTSAPYQRAARTLAYLKLEQGYAEEALAILEPIAARPGHRSTRLLALLALALRASGRTERAMAMLESALLQAAPGGHLAAFLELGRPMAELLAQGAHRWKGSSGELAGQLLVRFGQAPVAAGRGAGLVDPPSPRELEVLALLAEGASNEEIARRLYVSLNTSKKHVANLMSKLGAANRTQAVARARELGLLP